MANRFNPSLRDIGGLIFLLYKSIQHATLHALEPDEKTSLLRKDLLQTHPSLQVVGEVSVQSKKIRYLTQEVLQDTLNNCGNKLLLNSNHPVINCENFDTPSITPS